MLIHNKYISGACNISTKGGSKWNFQIFQKLFQSQFSKRYWSYYDSFWSHCSAFDVIFAGIYIITHSALQWFLDVTSTEVSTFDFWISLSVFQKEMSDNSNNAIFIEHHRNLWPLIFHSWPFSAIYTLGYASTIKCLAGYEISRTTNIYI